MEEKERQYEACVTWFKESREEIVKLLKYDFRFNEIMFLKASVVIGYGV